MDDMRKTLLDTLAQLQIEHDAAESDAKEYYARKRFAGTYSETRWKASRIRADRTLAHMDNVKRELARLA